VIERVSKREKISWRLYMGIFRQSPFIDAPVHNEKFYEIFRRETENKFPREFISISGE
jgi:hypothetical protein